MRHLLVTLRSGLGISCGRIGRAGEGRVAANFVTPASETHFRLIRERK
jgi:hypothetical protein